MMKEQKMQINKLDPPDGVYYESESSEVDELEPHKQGSTEDEIDSEDANEFKHKINTFSNKYKIRPNLELVDQENEAKKEIRQGAFGVSRSGTEMKANR